MLSLVTTALLAQHSIEVKDGALRLVHVSDTHYHPNQLSCSDVPKHSPHPCTHANTTNFLKSVMAVETPDMVAYTGDIIDGGSVVPKHAMDGLYGIAIDAKVPWAASLGNHDEESSLSREEVVSYISGLSGTTTVHGPVAGSPGNFYVDVVNGSKTAMARLVFFDSRIDHVHEMINDAQLAWFKSLGETLPQLPTLAFYHIPLHEYKDAVAAKVPMSGQMNEPICNDGPNPHVFPTLKAGGVVAGFCGHDHTNDFCVKWEGVQLCYEGSPGFTAYGKCFNDTSCVARRVRVTELQLTAAGDALQHVRSWKRVDGGGATAAASRTDDEVLWSASGHTAAVVKEEDNRRPHNGADVGRRLDQPRVVEK